MRRRSKAEIALKFLGGNIRESHEHEPTGHESISDYLEPAAAWPLADTRVCRTGQRFDRSRQHWDFESRSKRSRAIEYNACRPLPKPKKVARSLGITLYTRLE